MWLGDHHPSSYTPTAPAQFPSAPRWRFLPSTLRRSLPTQTNRGDHGSCRPAQFAPCDPHLVAEHLSSRGRLEPPLRRTRVNAGSRESATTRTSVAVASSTARMLFNWGLRGGDRWSFEPAIAGTCSSPRRPDDAAGATTSRSVADRTAHRTPTGLPARTTMTGALD